MHIDERAKRILREIWGESSKGRNHITTAIDKIDFEDRIWDGVNYYTIDKNIETKAHIKRQMIFDS
jgi:hypothetical protein